MSPSPITTLTAGLSFLTTMNLAKARLFLIDDHPAVRQGLRLVLFNQHHDICGEAGSIAETLARIGDCQADCAILDLSLDQENGLDLIAALREMGVLVLIYSMHEDADTIQRAFAAGANGYVSKREMGEVLDAAIGVIRSGESYISPYVSKRLEASDAPQTPAERVRLLSAREREILQLLGAGEPNNAIAERLAISIRTVETHFARMTAKLQLDGVKTLRRFAIQRERP